MHTVTTPPTATLSSRTPGTSTTINVTVNNATVPSTVTGSVAVDFNGDTVTAPLTVNFTEQPVPTATVDMSADPSLSVVVGAATPSGGVAGRYVIPITITVV